MREIIFRGKRVDNGKWAYGQLAEVETAGDRYEHGRLPVEFEFAIVRTDLCIRETIIIGENTICQYTGSTDKNGTKIFEGDICKVNDLIYKVVFNYGQWNFKIISDKYYCCPCFYSNCGEYCEVIGNIFDSQELMEI